MDARCARKRSRENRRIRVRMTSIGGWEVCRAFLAHGKAKTTRRIMSLTQQNQELLRISSYRQTFSICTVLGQLVNMIQGFPLAYQKIPTATSMIKMF